MALCNAIVALITKEGVKLVEKKDRRQVRTAKWLQQALLALVREKGIDGVTVSALTERAEVNRGTFYLHFESIADMLERTKQTFLEELDSILRQLNLRQLMTCALNDTPYPVVVELITYLDRHGDYFEVMFGPKGDPALPHELQQLMQKHMYDKLVIFQPDEHRMQLPRDYLIAYVASANMGILRHWLGTGRALPPEAVARLLLRIVKSGPLATTGIRPSV